MTEEDFIAYIFIPKFIYLYVPERSDHTYCTK